MRQTPRVLYAEDHPASRAATASFLRSAGFDVREASDGRRALALIAERPDLAVLDVCLPGPSGLDVCRAIRADPASAATPVVLVSGAAVAAPDRAGALEGGADAFLTKPLDPEVLVAQARALLRARRAEESLRRAHARQEAILRGVADGIALLGPGGRLTYANDALARMLGSPSAEALLAAAGDPLAALGPADEAGNPIPPHRLPGAAVLAGAPEAEALVQWRGRDGGRRAALVRATPIRDEGGRLRCAVCILHDVTERKRLEEQFLQAQKMEAVGRLAGGVAHDFNNLLTVINGFGEMLLAALPPELPARAYAEEVARAGERAAGLTRQLLAFSRQQVIQPRPLDLNAVVSGSEALLRRLIGEDVELAATLAEGLPPVLADPGQLEQVLMNLAVNARDAMPRGGRLTIETRPAELGEEQVRANPGVRPGPYVLLAVSDTGCGMDEATRARAFEPFFTTKGPGKGTGLGLATVYGIVRAAGGHAAIASEPGRGTTFEIYLPPAAGEARAAAAVAGEAPGGTETVLLVEDDAAVRALAKRALERRGYDVLEAGGGGAALAVSAGAGAIHLLVTDVVMPGMGGRELAGRLRGLRPGLRVLYMSGYTDDALVRHGVLAGEAAFLQKPFTPESLARKVREVLDGPPPSQAGAALSEW